MTDHRRPISLLTSVALGLGAALALLLAGRPPAAAAPAAAGLNPPILTHCYARDDSAVTVYSTADSAAVRSAVAAAVPNDVVRLAGTCAGVVPQGGTTQTVLIDKALTLAGGYTTTDWADSFPLTQPTTLDAQGLGRVITASADITIAELTVQHGISFGGDGGGIYAGGNLTMIGAVAILSNTTGVTPTLRPTLSPMVSDASRIGVPVAPSISAGSGNGGGFEVLGNFNFISMTLLLHLPSGSLVVQGNSAGYQGGGADVAGNTNLTNFIFSGNSAGVYGGGGNVIGSSVITNGSFVSNTSGFAGGGLYTYSNVDMNYVAFTGNSAVDGGGWAPISLTPVNAVDTGGSAPINGNAVNATHDTFDNNSAEYGGALDSFQVFLNVGQSYFTDDTATSAGGEIASIDSKTTVKNVHFIEIIDLEGEAELYTYGSVGTLAGVAILFSDLVNPGHGVAASTTGVGNPVASSSVPTASAISASRVPVFVTDTIIAGFPIAFETSQTGTISGDYNLFDTTPVISGTNITTGTHSIVGNPLFSDALGHLSAGSPAIDHGVDAGVYTDLDGNPRPSGVGFDIGAYEFQFALLKLFLPLVRK